MADFGSIEVTSRALLGHFGVFGGSFPRLRLRVCHFCAKCGHSLKEFVHSSATESSILVVEKCLGNVLLFNVLPVPC